MAHIKYSEEALEVVAEGRLRVDARMHAVLARREAARRHLQLDRLDAVAAHVQSQHASLEYRGHRLVVSPRSAGESPPPLAGGFPAAFCIVQEARRPVSQASFFRFLGVLEGPFTGSRVAARVKGGPSRAARLRALVASLQATPR